MENVNAVDTVYILAFCSSLLDMKYNLFCILIEYFSSSVCCALFFPCSFSSKPALLVLHTGLPLF